MIIVSYIKSQKAASIYLELQDTRILGKVERLSKRDLRRLAKMIVEEIAKKLHVDNTKVAGPRGLEPRTSGKAQAEPSLRLRRPASYQNFIVVSSRELTTDMPSLPAPPVDNSLVSGFSSYLSGRVTENTLKDYVSVIQRGAWPPEKRSHTKAWRKYVQFLFSIGKISWEQLQQYKAFLKTPRSKSILRTAVDEKTIVEYVDVLRENGLGHIAYLLLGGARLSHIVQMLNTYSPDEIVRHPDGSYDTRLLCFTGFCRYYLGIRIGSKRCDYIYFPAYPYPVEKQEISYRKLRDKLRRLGVQAKLFRKYVNQVLEELAMKHNIRLDAVNLIMSRELSITGAHYLDTRKLADKLFETYVKTLYKFIFPR